MNRTLSNSVVPYLILLLFIFQQAASQDGYVPVNGARLYLYMMSLKFYQYDLRQQLSTFECPTLIVQGDFDVVLPKYAEEVQKLMPKSMFVVLKGCGHFPYVEKEEDFFGIISNTAGGYCFYQDSRMRPVTRYRYNNIPMDGNGR